jgi:transposase InsO family protein
MAKALGISRSEIHEKKKGRISNRKKANMILLETIRCIRQGRKKVYGVVRVFDELQKMGVKCGENRLSKVMREAGIYGRIWKKFRIMTTDSKHENPISADLLKRNFFVERANRVWISDITYIRTKAGFLYLCVILDLYSRKVVGWSMSRSLASEIVESSLDMAINLRKPDNGCIFHSDRGVQYTSSSFREKLKANKFRQSMSRKGNCWDNACAESFFGSMKREISRNVFENFDEAKKELFDYIEVFYNRERSHSYLNYLSPNEFEQKLAA